MSKRLWLLGVGTLVLAGFLVACGSNYNSSSDGLVLVGSQGSSVIETFSFNLNTGHASAVANSPNDTGNSTCILKGIPTSIVMDPKGAYAYAIIQADPACNTAETQIGSFKIGSNGTITEIGTTGFLKTKTNVSVVPASMVMDAAGKFLFVADRGTVDSTNHPVPGAVSVFAIGSGGSVKEVSGSPFFTNVASAQNQDFVAVVATPTVFPAIGISGLQNAVCSVPGNNPPSTQFVYAVDSLNYVVWEFQVNTSTGALGPPGASAVPSFATDAVPAGIAVDPCDRFVYVTGSQNNRINVYTICTAVSQSCPKADGSLLPVQGSPFSMTGSANGPGPLVADPFGNYIYVLGLLSNTVSPFKVSPVTGKLTNGNPAVLATGLQPKSIAIRNDDTWLFVTNYGAATVTQYSVTPSTGVLNAQPPIQTDNQPWGLAVK